MTFIGTIIDNNYSGTTRNNYCNPRCECAPRGNFIYIAMVAYLDFYLSRMFFEQRLLYCTKITNKNEKHFKNEQRSRDAAAKKRANTMEHGKVIIIIWISR